MIDKSLINQPLTLKTLFYTEMWERFSYYGMRALLVLYLVESMGYSDFSALEIYAIYTGLVYVTPILGGYLADQYLGQNKSILIGAIVMMLGHLLMALPEYLFLAMGLLIIGNGFFKPNISTLLGKLYKSNDTRRDSAYSLFYVGINIGAFIAPIVIGFVGETVSWHLGFTLAAIGMLIGLIQFIFNQNKIISEDLTGETTRLNFNDWLQIISISAITIPFVLLVFQLLALLLIFLVFQYRTKIQKVSNFNDLKKVAYIFLLSIFVIFFWIGFEQAGGSLTLFAKNSVDRSVGHYEIPATLFQSINPLIIIFMGPLIANFWLRSDKSQAPHSTSRKMSLGIFLLGLGFLILSLIQGQVHIHFSWLILIYFLHTIGELCLSPIGLSMVSRVSPRKLASMMMGIWFLSSAAANYFAGKLPEFLHNLNIDLFIFLTLLSFIASIILFFMAPFLEKLIQEK
jgi:POT family proton-dependent oligopeptide transporter